MMTKGHFKEVHPLGRVPVYHGSRHVSHVGSRTRVSRYLGYRLGLGVLGVAPGQGSNHISGVSQFLVGDVEQLFLTLERPGAAAPCTCAPLGLRCGVYGTSASAPTPTSLRRLGAQSGAGRARGRELGRLRQKRVASLGVGAASDSAANYARPAPQSTSE